MSDQSSLFESETTASTKKNRSPITTSSTTPAEPLAARMRPHTLDEILGQELIARQTHAHFVALSAVSAGVADLRKVVEDARKLRQFSKQRTIMFIDEIHRFNKAQQDAVLPHVERGVVTLIGATTENPSFEVIAALLSRCRVFTLRALTEEQILVILLRALEDKERGLGQLNITIDKDALQQIAAFEDVMQHRALLYDKAGDQHYDTISALHKALRGSDPDAGLYWLGRMLEAGEDPLYIVRRLIRFASEDVGMADPQALVVCVAAQQAVHFVGMPEANLALAQAVVYLATAPKSNALYEAYSRVQEDVQQTRNDPVPLWIRNAPTQLMKDLDYGKDYKYAHDYYKDMQIEDPERPPTVQLQAYLPESLKGRQYYEPGHQGKEASIKKWLEKRRGKEL